jgi:hypothetical protein
METDLWRCPGTLPTVGRLMIMIKYFIDNLTAYVVPATRFPFFLTASDSRCQSFPARYRHASSGPPSSGLPFIRS